MNKKLSKIALDILGIILALICLSPFYIIIVNSFKTKGELFESTLALPEKFNLDNYTRAWEQLDYIKVLGKTLAYKIDQIQVIEPNHTEALKTVSGKDYVTLLTCTPYGVNSHRLLVRGVRVKYDSKQQKDTEQNGLTSEQKILILAAVITSVVMLIVIIVVSLYRRKKG